MPKFAQPQPPVFKRVEDERLHRKQRLAAVFRLFACFGFSERTAFSPQPSGIALRRMVQLPATL